MTDVPAGWEVMTSRSKGLDYYFNKKTGKQYWVDKELPVGWSYVVEADRTTKYYFHITDEAGTKTYDKPTVPSREPATEPAPPPPKIQTSQRRGSNSLQDLLSPVNGPADKHDQSDNEEDATPPKRSHYDEDTSSAKRPRYNSSPPPVQRPIESSRRYDPVKDEAVNDESTTDQHQTAHFYSKLQRKSTGERADSLLYHMRCLNNWVKSVLIQEYSQKQSRVLDLACGKGGDMNKWLRNDFQMYMGVDIALGSLEDAAERIQKNLQLSRSDMHLVHGDLGEVSLLKDTLDCWNIRSQWHRAVPLDRPHSFDVVSMQFAFHYMFCDEARADLFFRTLQSTLRPGGMFIATTVDANRIIQKLLASVGDVETNENGETVPAPIRIVDAKDRALCTVRMDPSTRERILNGSGDDPGFGLRYMFTLSDNDEEEAVNLPEYLIPTSLLRQLIHDHGFDLVLQENFQTFIGQNKDIHSHRNLLSKMNVLNFQGTISDVEWDIAGLYQVLAFKKRMS
ncbi:unnamed protein product [Aphanomyces euteiches]